MDTNNLRLLYRTPSIDGTIIFVKISLSSRVFLKSDRTQREEATTTTTT